MSKKNHLPKAKSPLAGCLAAPEIDPENRSCTARLYCPRDFTGFEGHFPGEPLLPAVLQLMAVRLTVEAMLGETLQQVAVERLKFKGMIRPEEEVFIRVNLNGDEGDIRVSFSLERENSKVSSGTLVLKSRDRN